ncbi:sigma factor [Paenarthrobacter ilicis]|uniref:DNA-directed RNA polymerase specialized sigma24 family protein n=1 Tax=Paenarthrobacter ilicis TaxID=43665 RepID=A0ABX0TMF4_9MICC|nr:sigma factor [Paenarthrobacter ilicis]MBM7793045.1 DNA-directed RNA polymerase specialized sigma24 family protein [Paenarthrobacter ilicis]NIJ03020.1 DNA-directed RNA polymerase specialized sigma24 family protein [Paenarthrobacter ilicis]
MSLEHPAGNAEKEISNPSTVDISLLNPVTPTLKVSVDQMMGAVEGVRRYVISHLARIGRSCDVDDVMQDIRMAVWDGVARGNYRQIPGVPFEAWVQGVAGNVCAAHVRRELGHKTLPLLLDPGNGESPVHVQQLTALVVSRDYRDAEELIDQEWALMVLRLTRAAVSAPVWRLAVGSLTEPRRHAPPSPQDRRRWNAVTAVRQTAKTISEALEVDPVIVHDMPSLCRCAVGCLPSPLLRGVAEAIVLPEHHGVERQVAITAVAEEYKVTDRYVAVQIGAARRLYQTAWRVIRSSMNSAI